MKVSHHGSRGSRACPRCSTRLRPQVAAIEVGTGNSYGHPAPETLAALQREASRTSTAPTATARSR